LRYPARRDAAKIFPLIVRANAISGARCNPHPDDFTDSMLRPGDQAFFDILQSRVVIEVLLPHLQCGPCDGGPARCLQTSTRMARQGDRADQAGRIDRLRLQRAAEGRSVRPKAEAFGFPDEMSAFGLQFGHGLGLALHERPILSRVTSLTHPTEIKEGMVFALETCCPAIDGAAAAHSERKVIDNGGRVIPLFPAEELPISHRY
jgi:Xaa-Pro aminopeptidase